MSAEPPIDDDPILRRVAAVRPAIPEDDLSPDGRRARLIAERALAGGSAAASRRSRGRWSHPRWTLPWVGLALAPVTAAVVLVLVLVGTFSGPDSSGTQPASAAVIRAVRDAIATSPGTIVVEDETFITGHGHPYTLDQVLETPTGPGPQNMLTTTDDPAVVAPRERPAITGWSNIGGEEAIYSPSTNTIYESSIWGPYLHPGPRPGTFVYRNAPGAPATAVTPVIVTARQRQALLSGQAVIRLTSKLVGSKVQIGSLKVLPPLRGPEPYAQSLQQVLAYRYLHLVGRTTVNGRAAIELAGRTTDGTAPGVRMYFDPTTHLPFEVVTNVGTRGQQVILVSLRRLPITPTTERLLSLQALHPTARIDDNHQDYLRAADGVLVFSQ